MGRQVLLSNAARRRAGMCQSAAIALGLVLLVPAPAAAQTATGTAQAVIVEPLGLVKVQDLKFGRIAATTSGGTIVVNADTGACTASGSVRSAGGCGSAQFAGRGVRRLTVRIQVPAAVNLTGPAGATMVADTITLGASPDLVFLGGAIGGTRRYQVSTSSGIFTFRMGGRLNVGAGQRPGQYSGTFPVTVEYQ